MKFSNCSSVKKLTSKKQKLTVHLHKQIKEYSLENDLKDDNYMSLMFRDSRDVGSMLLTHDGWEIMKNNFKYWSVKLTSNLNFGDHEYLIKNIEFPYYVDGNSLHAFDSNFGVFITMVDGDFEKIKKLF